MLRTLRGGPRRPREPAEIGRQLGLGRERGRELRQLLGDLVRRGRLQRVGSGYRLARADGLVEGRFGADARQAGGSVRSDDGSAWRVPDAHGARSGDRVLLLPVGRATGEIVQVLSGGREHWIGILQREGRHGPARVTPYRDDAEWSVRVAARDLGGAREGEVVAVAPSGRRRGGMASGRVVETFGFPGEPEADFRAVVWRRRLPVDFPAEVLAEAERFPEQPEPGELARRVDLRESRFCTIDPASARDHDDALCVEPLEDGSARLLVAIADVSHYVAAGSALDREALSRGNSVYFPDRAIPMLPERLSAELCSLRPGVERLALVAELRVDPSGRAHTRGFYPAVIRSHARLVYGPAARVMDGASRAEGVASDLVPMLRELAALARRLAERRAAQGSIDLDLPAPHIVMGEDGRPRDVVPEPRTTAHRAVEEAMLAANRAVAEALHGAAQPALYRVHEPPAAEDLETLADLLARLGLLRGRGPQTLDARTLASLLRRVEGHPEERLVNQAVLRSMRLARYEASSRGHFALAFAHYTHFTSPIRRYADLVVHRALKSLLGEPEGASASAAWARRTAVRLSWLERRAEAAEREMADLKKCALLAPRVGESFSATVTGVAPHGLYVTFDAPFVEGLVHVSRLPRFVDFDARHHSLVARGSGERYGLGDRMQVRLDAVDPVRTRIDCSIVRRTRS